MTPWTPGLPVHHQLSELAQTHVHRVSDAIQPSHPLSSPSPPAFNLSQNQVFPKELTLRIRWPKYWSFSISPSNEYLGLTSFRMDWLDLLALQGTLKSVPSENPGVGCHFLLQGIFPNQGLNPTLLKFRQILYHWATREAPVSLTYSATIL